MLTTLFSLYGILVALNVLDGISTWNVVKPNFYARETNPVARWMFIKLGITRGIILAEVLWIGFITLVFFLFYRDQVMSTVLLIFLCVGILVFLQVVSGNFRIWKRIRQRKSLLASQAAEKEQDSERA